MRTNNRLCIKAALMTVLLSLGLFSTTVQAELTRTEVKDLVNDIERATDDFKRTIEKTLGQIKGEEKSGKDRIDDAVGEFETATDKLRREVTDDKKGLLGAIGLRLDVKRVVDKAGDVDKIIRAGEWAPSIKLDWIKIRTAVNVLAGKYDLDKINAKD